MKPAALLVVSIAFGACSFTLDGGGKAASVASSSSGTGGSGGAGGGAGGAAGVGAGGFGGSAGDGGGGATSVDAGVPCESDAGALGPMSLRLEVQPASAGWTLTFGETTPPCGVPNPAEVGFDDVCTPGGEGVEFSAHSKSAACCGCIGRQKSFPLAKAPPGVFNSNLATLHGSWFATTRGAAEAYSLASLRIDLLRNGVEVGTRELATEKRHFDNCSSPDTQYVLADSMPFDLPLQVVEDGVDFDEIVILVQGYGCGVADNSVTLGDLTITWTSP